MKNLFALSDATVAMYSQMFIYLAILSCVFWVLQVIAYWRLFKKAGVSGWQSIIPIYNEYKFLKITWKGSAFWIFALLGLLSGVFMYLLRNNLVADTALIVLSILQIIVGFICLVMHGVSCSKIAHSYGKGGGFAFGLFFLRPLFILILGLGSSKYRRLR